MTVAEEIPHLFDCFLVKLDIVNCPMAEIPLADLFDLVTSSLLENYLDIIRGVVVEMLEDAMWIDESTREKMVDTGFALFEVRDGPGLIISLRAAALQRYVAQSIANRQMPISTLRIPIMVRFKMTAVEKITPRDAPVAVIDIIGDPPVPRSGPPSNVSEGELLDQVSELPISSPVPQVDSVAPVPSRSNKTGAENVAPSVQFASEDIATPRDEPRSVPGTGPANRGDNEPAINTGATFRGNPVDVELRTTGHGATGTSIRRDYDSYSDYPDRERESSTQPRRGPLRYDEAAERYEAIDQERGRTPRRSPTKNHPYTDEVTFGAETFKDYMTQFQSTDVKFKDFRKITLPKFDSSKNDSFVHWYKLLVSTCLQYGVWCPPYESVEEDNIYGAWWKRLPQSVKDQEAFMAHLLYTVLIRPETFPPNSRELEAVEGSSANAGYNAIYNILRMHHPLLHSVLSMANSIPMHRRAESFSLYLRRLQEFFARERLATRTYTESEALDLAVRNLSAEWRSEFRRLVERDKRSGNGGRLPFKLALPQMATTFVEYASEIGRDPPGSSHSSASSRSASTTIMRRLETVVDDTDDSPFLPDDDVELIVRAIARNQESSEVCLGCQLPGHTLVDCNRFVDYIVAESLAQRNPTLRTQVANSHSHFRTRLNAASARSRTTSTAPSHGARVRSLQENTTESSSSTSPPSEPAVAEEADSMDHGYRQHAIQLVGDTGDDDFESCFGPISIRSIELLGVDASCPSSAEMVSVPAPAPIPDPFVLRRLAETYDVTTSASFAHADNGSMANTVHDATLLFAYRLLKDSKVRLLDAGDHAHHPLGVGFLCVPTTNRGIAGAPTSVFIRTYHTPTIPGIIISHSAVSKQLGTSGYHMSSHTDSAGFIHFPHRLRRCQDVYVTLQPTSQRGGLTFTEALILPTAAQHGASIVPSSLRVLRLCSDHQSGPPATIVDPTDGMYCQACQLPPLLDFR